MPQTLDPPAIRSLPGVIRVWAPAQVALILEMGGHFSATHGGPPVVATAPGHAAWAGPGWLAATVAAHLEAHPGGAHLAAHPGCAMPRLVVDCGPDPGLALAALRLGAKGVALDAGPARPRLAALAATLGAEVVELVPPWLDLPDDAAAARRALARFIGMDRGPPSR